jgi:hypothetical protein
MTAWDWNAGGPFFEHDNKHLEFTKAKNILSYSASIGNESFLLSGRKPVKY